MSIDRELHRPAFERWYEETQGEAPGPTDSEGSYVHPAPDADWVAWCAAFESLLHVGEANLGTIGLNKQGLAMHHQGRPVQIYRLPEVKA